MSSLSAQSVIEQHAVIDTWYRWAAGLDDLDEEMLRSAMAETVFMDMSGYREAGLPFPDTQSHRNELATTLIQSMGHLTVQHCLTNFQVSVGGEGTASSTHNTVAYHRKRGDGQVRGDDSIFVMAHKVTTQYVREAARVEGEQAWKIKSMYLTPRFVQGDMNVLGSG